MKARFQKIRELIEGAKPADEYFAERAVLEEENPAKNVYQKHLDALIEEHDALVSDEYLNKREAVSIRALVTYVAHEHNLSEAVACAIVEEQFGLEEIRKLPRKRYMDAVEYLVDFDPKKIMN